MYERAEPSDDITFEVPAHLALPTLFELRPWLHPGGELPGGDPE